MSEHSPEEKAILEAMQRLEAPDPGAWPAAEAPADLVREYTEILGLLSYSLTPETPPSGTREALLARVTASGVAVSGEANARPVEDMTLRLSSTSQGLRPDPKPVVEEAPLHHDVEDITLHQGTARHVTPLGGVAGRRPSRAAFALAAVLAVCLVGMGYLFGQTQEQGAKIQRLEDQLAVSVAEIQAARDDLERLNADYQMVTSIARIAYPMHPARRTREKCSGTVFVCGQHQKWLFRARNVEPPSDTRSYHLWFVTRRGMVHAGTVEVQGGFGQLDASSMPDGTRGFALSLEEAPKPEKPGEIVLIGDKQVQL